MTSFPRSGGTERWSVSNWIALVPKLLLGNPVSEAPASRVGKLELPRLHSQAELGNERIRVLL